MSYDSNSSLDRALELAKKRFLARTPAQAKVNLIPRAMQFNYVESEDGGGSNAKRHLGSGPEIHLKLLIPRFTHASDSFDIQTIYFSNVAGHVIGKGGDTIAELR